MSAFPWSPASFGTVTWRMNVLVSGGNETTSANAVALAGNGVLTEGTIVFYDAAAGTVIPSDGDPAGAAPPNAVYYGDDADTTVTDQPATVFLTGKMREDALIWPPAPADPRVMAEFMRTVGLFVETVQPTDGGMEPLSV